MRGTAVGVYSVRRSAMKAPQTIVLERSGWPRFQGGGSRGSFVYN